VAVSSSRAVALPAIWLSRLCVRYRAPLVGLLWALPAIWAVAGAFFFFEPARQYVYN
jgi:hypothetical protein